MSRTDLDATTLANSLRTRAGDGSIEWVSEPIQASVLLDIADMLDENAKLRKLCADMYRCSDPCNDCPHYNGSNDGFYCDLGIGWKARRMRELGIEVEG